MIGLRKTLLRSLGVSLGALGVMLAAGSAQAFDHTPANSAALTQVLNGTSTPVLLPGDTITLTAGTTYTGTFTLPNLGGSSVVTIRSSQLASLPAAGTRVGLSNAVNMPKIVPGNSAASAIKTAPSAHHFKLSGLEVITYNASSLMTNDLIMLGDGAYTSETQEPRYITIDRCIVRAHSSTTRIKRGIALNSRYTDILDSYIAGIKTNISEPESQAIGSWNGHGPFNIINNYIEGAGENVMFGGQDPLINGLIPTDIVFTKNYLSKPLSWNPNDPSYVAPGATVKNIFELKNARNVLIEGNIFEHNWVQSQDGTGILFTVRNQSGGAPWCDIDNVTFRKNIVRKTAHAFNILGKDSNYPSGTASNINIENNLIYEVGGLPWTTTINGHLYKLTAESDFMTFNHNTTMNHLGNVMGMEGAADAHTNFAFINSIQNHNNYGVIGTGYTTGNPTLNQFFLNANFNKNVLFDNKADASQAQLNTWYSSYDDSWNPVGLMFPQAWSTVLVNQATPGTNFAGWKVVGWDQPTNATTYPYNNTGLNRDGTADGKDIGCDIDEVVAATAGCVSGVWGTTQVAAPSFSPAPGTYTSAQTVTISTTTPGASIRYTTNGTTPTSTTGTLYTAPVSISATTTLKAIAYASGMTDSTVTTGVYTINITSTTKVLRHNLNGYTGASSFHCQAGANTAVHTGYPNSVYYHPVNKYLVTNSSMVRPFYRFDLTQSGNSIPAGAIIDSATLKIRIDSISGSGSNDIMIHRVAPTTAFTVNYSNASRSFYNGTTGWSGGASAGGDVGDLNNDFLDTPEDTEQLTTVGSFLNFTVTSSVQAWVNGTPNNGWLFRTVDKAASLSSTIDTAGSAEYAELTIVYH